MSEMESFLATVAIFRELSPEELREVAPLCQETRYEAGTTILNQGGYSQALYFLRSGRLAVKVRKGDHRETVAHLQPPAVFGELSFITGRACSADVEVVVDANVVSLPKSAMARIETHRDRIVHGMMNVLAERLHDTVSKGAKAPESPVILLRNLPHWEAPGSFAAELAKSLSRQTDHETLLVHLSEEPAAELRPLSNAAFETTVAVDAVDESLRAGIAQRLTDWKTRFTNVILSPVGPRSVIVAERIDAFADSIGVLAGPGDPLPDAAGEDKFIVQSAAAPTLRTLCGNQQLIWEAAESEQAYRQGRSATQRFIRTVDSIARSILGLQVGVALGGGAAWGWAHIGMLEQFEKAGLPIDVVSGCSMGSVIGALRCSGFSVMELFDIAEYWRTRTRRFVEWRFWRMSLISEKVATKVFTSYFGERTLNQMEIPYWANAVDIKTGHEYTIQDGSIVDCIRASIALPGLLPPFEKGKSLLVDAGIMDPVPVNLVRRMGASYVVAVNAMAALESQTLSKRFQMIDIMMRCTRIMGHEIGQARAEESANIVVTPTLGDISMLDFGKSPEIIECGRRAAEANLPAIMAGYERMKTRQRAEPAVVAPKTN